MAEVSTMRDGIAARIKKLSQKWAENTVALGQEFRLARDTFPVVGGTDHRNASRPGWYEWVERETGWSSGHATRVITVAEKFGSLPVSSLSFNVLEYLSREQTPEQATKEILDRAKGGEVISLDKAKQIIKPHLPTPAQAMKEARETGKLIHARDGHIYSGATEDEMMAHSQRRHVIYTMKDNITDIAECPLTPNQWIKSIGNNDHWISEFKLRNIDVAIKFLTALRPLLKERQDEI